MKTLSRGRRRGLKLSDGQKLTLQAAMSRSRATRLAQQVQALTAAVAPSQSQQAVQVLSVGGIEAKRSRNLQLFVPGGQTVVSNRRRRTADDWIAASNRGLISHVVAQASGLSRLASAQGTGAVIGLWSTNVFDDATMWVNSKSLKKDTYQEVEMHLKRKLDACGKNAHMQVLTQCENIFVARTDLSSDPASPTAPDSASVILSSSPVQSPCQVLPVANAMTVYDRWLRWTAVSTAGSGCAVDKDRELQQALDAVAWKTIILAKDNLQLNMCLVHLQEQNLANAPEGSPVREMSMLDFKCACHSAVLSNKPLIASTGCNSILVKLGHVFESHRSHAAYLNALKSEVETSFEYWYAGRLPESCLEWRRQWASI